MEKRLLTAVTLSILLMLLYPVILSKFFPKTTAERVDQTVSSTVSLDNRIIKTQLIDNKAVNIENDTVDLSKIQAQINTKELKSDLYTLYISDIGGGINKMAIKSNDRADFQLVDKAFYDAGILSIHGKGILDGVSYQKFEISQDKNTIYTEYNRIKIEKTVSFLEKRYGFDTVIKFINNSDKEQVLDFDITTASNISDKELMESRLIEAAILYKDGKMNEINSGNLSKNNKIYKDNMAWLALKNKYYSIVAKPDFNAKGIFVKNSTNSRNIGFIVENEVILPGETKIYRINFYAGPIDIKEAEKVDESFNKIVDFGFLTSLSLILLSALQFFYSLVHNYGVAILLLTLCVSLFLYPLTFKSLKSMQKLQEMQPHVEKLKQEHKDNPTKLNKEIMELYRRYKVNPMGGCLPMILQMPVFIALYNALSRSIQLKDAGFLWIKDLSMPDAFFKFDFNIPVIGNGINLLPILMIGAMILQQKISQTNVTGAQSEQQKLMANIMPVLFGFIFYSLPSGLVLYWLTNTLVSSGMQMLLMKKQ